ncbi:hypothetical protein TNCV_1306131 [Trichonephila clavipes]|nr:hypothetical protein TNCV_1306131 [Trichonephila clavipes]
MPGSIQGSNIGLAANVGDSPDEGGVKESWKMLGRKCWSCLKQVFLYAKRLEEQMVRSRRPPEHNIASMC